mgnify:FL=1
MKKATKIVIGVSLVCGILVGANNTEINQKGVAYDPVGGGIGGSFAPKDVAYDPVGGGIGGSSVGDKQLAYDPVGGGIGGSSVEDKI